MSDIEIPTRMWLGNCRGEVERSLWERIERWGWGKRGNVQVLVRTEFVHIFLVGNDLSWIKS